MIYLNKKNIAINNLKFYLLSFKINLDRIKRFYMSIIDNKYIRNTFIL